MDRKEPIGIIYITTNLINNKKYIGQHLGFDESYLGSGTILMRAVKKYGKENFKRETLSLCHTQSEMDHKEKLFIALYDATISKMFYNIHVGGSGGNTIAGWSEERRIKHKQKMSELTKGNKNGMYGRKHTKETKEKLRLINEERVNMEDSIYKSPEFKLKMSEVTKGDKNGMHGKNHTFESKLSMSINSKGITLGKKNGNYGCVGDLAKNGKAVLKYQDEKFTILLKKFTTMSMARDSLSTKGHTSLYKAIKEKTKYKGYYWKKDN